MKHNQALIDKIENMENRLRRKDILVSEEDLYEFYRQRIPVCYNMPMLLKLIKQKEDDSFLRMTAEELFRYFPKDEELSLYPESIKLGDRDFDTIYNYDPGVEKDGVTVKIPSTLAASVPHEQLDYLVPGLYKEKIAALVKGLPKEIRKKLVPLPSTVDIIFNEMPRIDSSLISTLGSFIYKRFGVDIPASAWTEDALPDHLRMRIAITDTTGKEVISSRDKSVLARHSRTEMKHALTDDVRATIEKWRKSDITKWDFGDLPDTILIKSSKGHDITMYPGLQNNPKSPKNVLLSLFTSRDEAATAHLYGVEALYKIHFAKDLKFLKKILILPKAMTPKAVYFGGEKKFETMLYTCITGRLFRKNIRSQKDFYACADSIAATILPHGTKLVESIAPVLDAYHETRLTISNLELNVTSNSPVSVFLEQMRIETAKLVPDNFLDLYTVDQFPNIVRYLKAMVIRITRAVDNLEKDQKKAGDVAVYTRRLSAVLKSISASTSEEKKKAIEELFWMIEEYKISVFAQELKTAIPISTKRLESKLKEIERMV